MHYRVSSVGLGTGGGCWLQRTSRSVAGLVVLGEVSEVEVLNPGDPFLVLIVVCLLAPLHGCVDSAEAGVSTETFGRMARRNAAWDMKCKIEGNLENLCTVHMDSWANLGCFEAEVWVSRCRGGSWGMLRVFKSWHQMLNQRGR